MEKAEKQKLVEKILSDHGIKMDLYGCGCCGSPYMKFEYKGEIIIDDEHVNIDNFPKEEIVKNAKSQL